MVSFCSPAVVVGQMRLFSLVSCTITFNIPYFGSVLASARLSQGKHALILHKQFIKSFFSSLPFQTRIGTLTFITMMMRSRDNESNTMEIKFIQM